MGYFISRKGHRVYKRTLIIEESMHVVFDEFNNSCLRNYDKKQIKTNKQTNRNEQAQTEN